MCGTSWKNSGYLDELDELDEFKSGVLGVLLENQKLINEMSTDTSDVATFKRISMPLVSKVFTKLLNLDLVSIYPMLGPTALFGEHNLFAITRKLNAIWTFEAQQDLRFERHNDAEQELVETLSEDILLEIVNEITIDLYENAGLTWHIKYEKLFKIIDITIETSQVDWIGGGKNIVNNLTGRYCNKFKDMPELSGYYEHKEKTIPIYYLPKINDNEILGVKKDSYIYAPYAPVIQTPTVLDPNSFLPRKGFMTRYSKRIVSNKGICKLVLSD